MFQTINNKIRQGFCDSAKQYDLYSSLHRTIADKLLAQLIQEPQPATILDVGCGTGYLTIKAKEHFPLSRVIGLDFAQGMLNVARQKHQGIVWVLADSNNLPFTKECFDSVISNLAYQWADDLSHAFSEARRVLIPGGKLVCTLFGYNTCPELFQSLQEASGGSLQFSRLPDALKIRESLIISGFKDPIVDREEIRVEFNGMYELMTWFKSIGAANLPREGYLGKGALTTAAKIYREKFPYLNGVGATFEVIRAYGKK